MSDEEDDFRPSFGGGGGGGLGFTRASAVAASDSEDERPSFGRAGGMGFQPPISLTQGAAVDSEAVDRQHEDAPPPKRMKFSKSMGGGSGGAPTAGAGAGGAFASRMMAKMGYKQGVGLGRDGRGRLAPIDAQLRPQGAGLGAVREKTKQAKDEEKRAAAFRGEKVEEDSEEEEKRRKKEVRKRRQEQGLSGMGVGRQPGARKTRYKTAGEIEVESAGLTVPVALKSIVDLSGKETTYATSMAGGQGVMVPQETEEMKIARRARRDLEAFAEEWNHAKEQMAYLDMENEQLVADMDQQRNDVEHMEAVVKAIAGLEELALTTSGGGTGVEDQQWVALTQKLRAIEDDFREDLDKFGIREIAIAAVQPLLQASMQVWEPLDDPGYLVDHIDDLQSILGANITQQQSAEDALMNRDEAMNSFRPSKRSTTLYETLMYTYWLPKVKSALNNDWKVDDPSPAVNLISYWKHLLPDFIFSHIIRRVVIPRLDLAIKDWNPRNSKGSAPPHTWISPWLEHIPEHHRDPKSDSGLAVRLKRKMASVLSKCPVENGFPEWLTPRQTDALQAKTYAVLPEHTMSQILTTQLLPRLSYYLKDNLEINPTNQDIGPLETVLSFQPLFSHRAFAELLAARLFPKIYSTLHAWLTGDQPDYGEIEAWFVWWQQEEVPADLRSLSVIESHWTGALRMIESALDIRSSPKSRLPPAESFLPPAEIDSTYRHRRDRDRRDRDRQDDRGHRRHRSRSRDKDRERRSHRKFSAEPAAVPQPLQASEEVTFRAVVEEFCAQHELMFLAMREAHPTNGAPLLRITANHTGRGGVVGYVHADLLFVSRKKIDEDGDEVTAWRPVGLGHDLLRMAHGGK